MLNGEVLDENILHGEIQREVISVVGVSDYNELPNKPQINGVELVGNKTSEELGLADIEYVDDKFNGANKAVSFVNYSAMISSLNALANTSYSVGQNIMIITLAVPDLWVSEIAEESVAYNYVSDDDFVNALNTNGSVQVGYYKLSALETQKVDLTDYVKNTDYATHSKPGIIKATSSHGFFVAADGALSIVRAQDAAVVQKTNVFNPLTPANIDLAVKVGVTTNTIELTDEEKATAQNWLGVDEIVDTKLDKVTVATQYHQLYGKTNTGVQKMYGVSHYNRSGNIPIFENASLDVVGSEDFKGTIAVTTPQHPYQAANKKYVDDIASTIPIFTATQLEDGSYSLTIGG